MSRASGYEILQKGVDNMITGQIIQTSIDELKAITDEDIENTWYVQLLQDV